MILTAHSDAGFNNKIKARIRADTHIFLYENEPIPCCNGPILTIAQIRKYVMSSSVEVEIGDLFLTEK